MSFAIWVSTSSNLPKVFSNRKMEVAGVRIAVLVVEIVKILRLFPDIYIMNAFIKICWPGLLARDMAWALRLAKMAFWFGPVVVGESRFRSAATTCEYPTDAGLFASVWKPSWFSFRFKSMETLYLYRKYIRVVLSQTTVWDQIHNLSTVVSKPHRMVMMTYFRGIFPFEYRCCWILWQVEWRVKLKVWSKVMRLIWW